jgi:hypothetical protein
LRDREKRAADVDLAYGLVGSCSAGFKTISKEVLKLTLTSVIFAEVQRTAGDSGLINAKVDIEYNNHAREGAGTHSDKVDMLLTILVWQHLSGKTFQECKAERGLIRDGDRGF